MIAPERWVAGHSIGCALARDTYACIPNGMWRHRPWEAGRGHFLVCVFFVFRFPISEITPEILPIQLCCAPTKPSYGPFEASVWSPRPQLYPHAIFSWWWQNCGRPRPPTVGAVNNDYTVKYTIKPIIKINMVSHHSVQINEFLHACMYTWLYMTS